MPAGEPGKGEEEVVLRLVRVVSIGFPRLLCKGGQLPDRAEREAEQKNGQEDSFHGEWSVYQGKTGSHPGVGGSDNIPENGHLLAAERRR